MNTLTASMVRGLKGAPASILILLQCVNQPVTNAWIAAQTGFTDKPVALALVYLKELGVVVHVLGGWRLARPEDEQLPFVLPEPDSMSMSRNESDSPNGVGVVVNSISNESTNLKQQQQTPLQSRNNSDSLTESRSQHILGRLGMWPKVQGVILAAMRPGAAGLADLLGWVAYCSDPENGIRNVPAVVAANLRGGERASSLYRPSPICQVCHRIDSACICDDRSVDRLSLPDPYDDKAFEAPGDYDNRQEWLRSRWVCPRCLAFPCECADEDAEDAPGKETAPRRDNVTTEGPEECAQ